MRTLKYSAPADRCSASEITQDISAHTLETSHFPLRLTGEPRTLQYAQKAQRVGGANDYEVKYLRSVTVGTSTPPAMVKSSRQAIQEK